MTITDLYQQLFGKGAIQDGTVIDMAEHGRVGGVSTGQGFKYVSDIGGLGIEEYDYVSLALTDADTETYTFKTGGAAGTTVATVVINYTDSTKGTITNVTKT